MTDRERLAMALDALAKIQHFKIRLESKPAIERSAYSMQALAADAMYKITMGELPCG